MCNVLPCNKAGSDEKSRTFKSRSSRRNGRRSKECRSISVGALERWSVGALERWSHEELDLKVMNNTNKSNDKNQYVNILLLYFF
jgi:hypothetical protein